MDSIDLATIERKNSGKVSGKIASIRCKFNKIVIILCFMNIIINGYENDFDGIDDNRYRRNKISGNLNDFDGIGR